MADPRFFFGGGGGRGWGGVEKHFELTRRKKYKKGITFAGAQAVTNAKTTPTAEE